MNSILRSHIAVAVRESLVISAAALVLGFSYTFVTEKGIFAPPPEPTPSAKATVAPEFISFEEALELHRKNEALFVDARLAYDYNLGHIPGAINVPLKDFSLELSPLASVQRDRLIVTYCDGADCNSSIELATQLSEAGFTRVKMFFGGWNEWQSRHLTIENGTTQ